MRIFLTAFTVINDYGSFRDSGLKIFNRDILQSLILSRRTSIYERGDNMRDVLMSDALYVGDLSLSNMALLLVVLLLLLLVLILIRELPRAIKGR